MPVVAIRDSNLGLECVLRLAQVHLVFTCIIHACYSPGCQASPASGKGVAPQFHGCVTHLGSSHSNFWTNRAAALRPAASVRSCSSQCGESNVSLCVAAIWKY